MQFNRVSQMPERLKVSVRAGNHIDHREVEVADAELRFRDTDGQMYRVDLSQPELLRSILRHDSAEPVTTRPVLTEAHAHAESA